MAITINKLTNAAVYIAGAQFLGQAEEVTLPTVKHKMAEHKGLGLMGELELWTGGIEKLEAKIKWTSFFKDVFSKTADPTKAVQIMLRGSLQAHNALGFAGSEAYVCYMTAMFKENPLGNFKHLDNAEFESALAISYVKLEVGGTSMLEVDVLSNIYKVNGVDVLAKFRIDIGA